MLFFVEDRSNSSTTCHPDDKKITLRSDNGEIIDNDATICDELLRELSINFAPHSAITVHVGSAEESDFQVDLSLQALLSVLRALPNCTWSGWYTCCDIQEVCFSLGQPTVKNIPAISAQWKCTRSMEGRQGHRSL